MKLSFGKDGPFDEEEQAVITDVARALMRRGGQEATHHLEVMRQNLARLDRLGEIVCDYPSIFAPEALGSLNRSHQSLVELLSRSNLSNFDMFLPTRALLARDLVMGEVNFYRLLRLVCTSALEPAEAKRLVERVDRRLCFCLYTRLAAEVLTHIASDAKVDQGKREKAVVALTLIWERTSYRVDDYFPVLHATWEARRRIRVTLGTLLGTAEMFRLIEAGCDERFVDYLVRPDHTEGEAEAFREFLFGATTEQLARIQQHMDDTGRGCLRVSEVEGIASRSDPFIIEGDPAIALFEFFLSRHLQAGARRLANLPGPRRTAEEYVMLNYLSEVPMDRLRLPRANSPAG